jgi:hypothetical protein
MFIRISYELFVKKLIRSEDDHDTISKLMKSKEMVFYQLVTTLKGWACLH